MYIIFTVTEVLKCQTVVENKETDLRKKKCVVLAEYLEQQTDYCRYKIKIWKSRRGRLLKRISLNYLPFLAKQIYMESMPLS